MAFFRGPNVVTNGLILALDAANPKSYVSGSTTWNDLSGNNYNGTLSGSIIPTFNASNGGSLSFTGGGFNSSSISEYSIPDTFWNSGSWSVYAWVKFNVVNFGGYANDNAIVGHGFSGFSTQIHLGERSARAQFGLYGNDLLGTIPLSSNTFYNIVWTFNYSSALKQIYVNSIFDTSGGSIGYTGTGSNTRIGSYSVGSFGLPLNGNLYNIQFYNKVLSASEVLQNYNALKSRFNLN
jgi:hypothetical protein